MGQSKAAARLGTAGAILLSAVVPAVLLAPGAAAESADPVSEAAGSALTVTIAGQSSGSGEFRATHDGTDEETTGTNTPPVPMGADRDALLVGGLAQDATAAADGTSAACAGLVGADGTLQVGPDATCLDDNTGRVSLSLGTLEDLALPELPLPDVPDLPELPEFPAHLPPMELLLEAEAITGQCVADPEETSGSARVVDGRIVGVLGDTTVPILDLPASGTAGAGLGATVADLLEQLATEVPGLDAILDRIPREELPTDQLIRVVTNEQTRDRDQNAITVTALRVEVVPNNLADVRIGRATCGPNRQLSVARPTPTPSQQPTLSPDEPQPMPTDVPAGLASAADDERGRGLGLGTVVVTGLAGLLLGGYLYRRRGQT